MRDLAVNRKINGKRSLHCLVWREPKKVLKDLYWSGTLWSEPSTSPFKCLKALLRYILRLRIFAGPDELMFIDPILLGISRELGKRFLMKPDLEFSWKRLSWELKVLANLLSRRTERIDTNVNLVEVLLMGNFQ